MLVSLTPQQVIMEDLMFDSLQQPLLTLLGVLEGEIQARDLALDVIRVRTFHCSSHSEIIQNFDLLCSP